MKYFDTSKKENKSRHLYFRIPREIYSYIEDSAAFFGVTKAFLIKERCLSEKYVFVHDIEPEQSLLDNFSSLGNELNDLAHKLNIIYQESLTSDFLHLVFTEDIFLQHIPLAQKCVEDLNLLLKEIHENQLFDYQYHETTLKCFHDIFDEYEPKDFKRDNRFSIRVTNSYYSLLKDVASFNKCSMSKYILECCLNPTYLDVSSISRNKDVLKVSKSVGTNLRQIQFALNKMNQRNKKIQEVALLAEVDSFYKLCLIIQDGLQAWFDFRKEIGQKEKELYFKYIKKRQVYDIVEQVLSDTNPEYLKLIRNRENHI